MLRSAARTLALCLLCLPPLVSAMRYEREEIPSEPVKPVHPAAQAPAPHTEHNVQDLALDIGDLSPGIKRASNLKVRVALPPLEPFEVTDYDFRGIDLARRQIARGLIKREDRRHHMDQSFEGLRDLIRKTSDPETKRFMPVVNRLERVMQRHDRGDGTNYVEGFISDFAPLALYLERETGLPASVTLAQIIVESGWGASNITILKNNVLGIGNCRGEDEFVADIQYSDIDRDIRVRCHVDTRAFEFDSVADSVLYYTYLLLENESNAKHYGALRRFIAENREMAHREPVSYRNRVIDLISRSYHADPDWYEEYLREMVQVVDETGILTRVETSMTLVADASRSR